MYALKVSGFLVGMEMTKSVLQGYVRMPKFSQEFITIHLQVKVGNSIVINPESGAMMRNQENFSINIESHSLSL